MRCLFHKWTKWGHPEIMRVEGYLLPRLAQYRECTNCGAYDIRSIAPAPCDQILPARTNQEAS